MSKEYRELGKKRQRYYVQMEKERILQEHKDFLHTMLQLTPNNAEDKLCVSVDKKEHDSSMDVAIEPIIQGAIEEQRYDVSSKCLVIL